MSHVVCICTIIFELINDDDDDDTRLELEGKEED